MSFKIENKKNYSIISSNVEKLDTQHAPGLKSEIVMLNAKGINNVILDLSKTRYCDSSGLSAILIANRLCRNAEGTFIVTCVQENVMKLIVLSQIDSVLTIIPTIEESVDFMLMEETERDLKKN